MTPAQRRHVLVGPIRVWLTLMLLVGATIGYAYLPDVPGKAEAGVAIAAAKAALIAILFMQLKRAAPLVRLAALAGLAWASLMWMFTFADVLTR